MRCDEFRKRLEDWRDGKTTGQWQASMESHRANCPTCAALAARSAATSRLLRLLGGEPPLPRPGFYSRLQAQIRKQDEQEQRWGPMEGWARRLAWGLSLAILILAIYLNVTAPRVASPPSPAQWTLATAGTEEGQDVLAGPRIPVELDRDQVMVSLVAESGR